MTTVRPLQQLDGVARALAAATSVSEVKDLRDRSEALRKYLSDARRGLDLQNQAAEIRLRAERKLGKLLKGMKLRGSARSAKGASGGSRLTELGVSRIQSFRWQKIAVVPDRQFEQYLAECREAEIEVTAKGLLRSAASPARTSAARRNAKRKDDVASTPSGASPLDDVEELCDHLRTLSGLLTPLADCESLAPGARKSLAYLVSEATRLAEGLRGQIKPATTPGDGP